MLLADALFLSGRLPRFLFATTNTGNVISRYRVEPLSGYLTFLGTTPSGGTSPRGASIDPTGRYLMVVNNGSTNVSSYSINRFDGQLTLVGNTASGISPISAYFLPSGSFAYATDAGGAPYVMGYTMNSSTGVLTNFAVGATGLNVGRGAVSDSASRFLYVGDFSGNFVRSFTINANGTLTSLNSVATGVNPHSLAMHPGGQYMYASLNSGSLVAFRVASDGTISMTATVAVSGTPQTIAIDPLGRYVYLVNATGGVLYVFSIADPTSPVLLYTFVMGPQANAVRVDPSGRFVYILCGTGSNQIFALYLDPFWGFSFLTALSTGSNAGAMEGIAIASYSISE